jgi:hypothetical protein
MIKTDEALNASGVIDRQGIVMATNLRRKTMPLLTCGKKEHHAT